MILNKHTYEKLIVEDIEWLLKQDRSLEREHIECVLADSVGRIYSDEIAELKAENSEMESLICDYRDGRTHDQIQEGYRLQKENATLKAEIENLKHNY